MAKPEAPSINVDQTRFPLGSNLATKADCEPSAAPVVSYAPAVVGKFDPFVQPVTNVLPKLSVATLIARLVLVLPR